MRVSVAAERKYLHSVNHLVEDQVCLVLAERLWERLKRDAGGFTSYTKLEDMQVRRWWWTVSDPISAIQVLASFAGVTCSAAEARLLWIGL